MGFFDFSKVNDLELSDRIKNRWQFLNNGFIIDSKRNNSLVWKVNVDLFENFLSGIERRSGESL